MNQTRMELNYTLFDLGHLTSASAEVVWTTLIILLVDHSVLNPSASHFSLRWGMLMLTLCLLAGQEDFARI
jgi:hypothetical protein